MILKADQLTKKFGEKTIFEKLSYEFKEGKIYAVRGCSGAGKSTFLAVVAGFLRPDGGRVLLEEKNIYDIKDEDYYKIHQKEGYVPQSNILMKNLTVLENITVPFLLEEDKDEEYLNETALAYLKKLGISDLKNKYPYEISGGEAKRVSIIRALLNDPKILILDEPTTGLDKKTGKIIFDFIDEYVKKGNTVIIASHDESLENYGVETIKLGD